VIERLTAQQMAKSQLGQYLVTTISTGASDGSNNNSSVAIAPILNKMFNFAIVEVMNQQQIFGD